MILIQKQAYIIQQIFILWLMRFKILAFKIQ